MGDSYGQIIREPWRRLKAQHFGDPYAPIHAADLHSISDSQVKAIADFFKTSLFSRFAAIMKITTSLPGTMIPY